MRNAAAAAARLLATALGIWLLFAPAVLDYGGAPAFGDRIIGALAMSAAFVSLSPLLAGVRWLTALLGLCLLITPWALGAPAWPTVSELLTGLGLLVLAPLAPRQEGRYGGGWRTVRPLLDRDA